MRVNVVYGCPQNILCSPNGGKSYNDFFYSRDFIGGTLGLAWVAAPGSSQAGGICEKFKTYRTKQGHIDRSTNSGLITLINYNTRVSIKTSQLTFAHEIGHNFGSPHDFPSYCKPDDGKGNYIMFASATSGNKAYIVMKVEH